MAWHFATPMLEASGCLSSSFSLSRLPESLTRDCCPEFAGFRANTEKFHRGAFIGSWSLHLLLSIGKSPEDNPLSGQTYFLRKIRF